MNHWKIVKSIWQKVEAKNPQNKLTNALTTIPENFSLRFCLTRGSTTTPTGTNHTGGNKTEEEAFKIVSKHYNVACQNHSAACVKFLNFVTEEERYNAWQSYLTKFARFCICMDESTKLAPYMGNYTQPWDDQRFYEYFGLTVPEIQLIETVIK
jgi:hypothetical protein